MTPAPENHASAGGLASARAAGSGEASGATAFQRTRANGVGAWWQLSGQRAGAGPLSGRTRRRARNRPRPSQIPGAAIGLEPSGGTARAKIVRTLRQALAGRTLRPRHRHGTDRVARRRSGRGVCRARYTSPIPPRRRSGSRSRRGLGVRRPGASFRATHTEDAESGLHFSQCSWNRRRLRRPGSSGLRHSGFPATMNCSIWPSGRSRSQITSAFFLVFTSKARNVMPPRCRCAVCSTLVGAPSFPRLAA